MAGFSDFFNAGLSGNGVLLLCKVWRERRPKNGKIWKFWSKNFGPKIKNLNEISRFLIKIRDFWKNFVKFWENFGKNFFFEYRSEIRSVFHFCFLAKTPSKQNERTSINLRRFSDFFYTHPCLICIHLLCESLR